MSSSFTKPLEPLASASLVGAGALIGTGVAATALGYLIQLVGDLAGVSLR